MSLINEALKKAQKQRAHEPHAPAPAGVPAPPTPRVAKRAQPMPAQTLVIIGMLCLVLIVAVVAGGWYIFSSSSTPPPAVATTPAPAPVKATQVATAPAGKEPTVVATAPQTTPGETPKPAVPTVVETPAPATTVANTPVTQVPTPPTLPVTTPAPVAAHPAPTSLLASNATNPTPTPGEDPFRVDISAGMRTAVPPNAKISAVVDTLKVSGIRASANDPKVLMNDRVFRLNDLVDRNTGLRLLEINTGHLVFIDENGATYTKNF